MTETRASSGGRGKLEAGLQAALAGLPPRVLEAAAAVSDSLLAVVCELGRGPQLWLRTGKAVVLYGRCSEEDLQRAVEAMAPWEEDGTSGVDGELHFRMVLGSVASPRGVVVYLHRHRQADLAEFRPAFQRALDERRPGMLVIGTASSQEHALRDISRLASSDLGLSTVVVDPAGRLAGRGKIPHPAIGGAAWVPVRSPEAMMRAAAAFLAHARPRVLVTAVDSCAAVQELLEAAGDTLVVAGVPVQSLDSPPQEVVKLAGSWPLAGALASPGSLRPVPDLRRAIALYRTP